MEESDSSAQLPLLSVAAVSGAQIIKLPLPSTANETAESTAAAAGLTDGKRSSSQQRRSRKQRHSLWYAIYVPQLTDMNEAQQDRHLAQLAALAQSISSVVSFHPQALVCEVRSSLKYFGGIDSIHRKLSKLITTQLNEWDLPEHFFYAASPTVTGSLLLARSGHNGLVYQKENLRSALGQLTTEVLRLSKEQNRRLYNMGIRHLKDIWRLPSDGLRKRFGSELLKQLNKALGTVPEPTRNYLPPPAFSSSYDLPYELENLDRLLPIADEMLGQLCDYLRRRDLSTSQLVFSLLHEKRNRTEIELGLRQSSRSQEHLLLLLETHFGNLTIPAPVTAVKIEVKKFDAFMSQSKSLLLEGKPVADHYNDSNLNQFMEQLQARLGDHHIKSINTVAEHCPEYASQHLDYGEQDKTQQSKRVESITSNPRPLWLLQKPLQLNVRRGKLYHRKPVSIISGPERIETRWWAGGDIRRDYYVAQEQNGSRLWIYKEKGAEQHWYLHGFFA